MNFKRANGGKAGSEGWKGKRLGVSGEEGSGGKTMAPMQGEGAARVHRRTQGGKEGFDEIQREDERGDDDTRGKGIKWAERREISSLDQSDASYYRRGKVGPIARVLASSRRKERQ